jgi:hypothetical protein
MQNVNCKLQIKRCKLKIVLILHFAFCILQFAQAQPYRLRVDSLRVDYKFYVGATDRFPFFGYLNSSNRVTSTTIEDGSILNVDITNPNILFSAGDGLSASGGQIDLGGNIQHWVNAVNPIVIIDDSLRIADSSIVWTLLDTAVMDSIRQLGASEVDLNPEGGIFDSSGLAIRYDPSLDIPSSFFLIESGNYTGDGNDDRTISTTFSLAQSDKKVLVLVKGNTAQYAVWRTNEHGADSSSHFYSVADKVNAIQSFSASGFVVGTDATVNSSSVIYQWVAISADSAYLNVKTYIGDGTNDRQISTDFQPVLAWVKNISTGGCAWKNSVMGTDTSITFAGGVSTGFINAFAGNYVQVDAAVNNNGVKFYLAAFANFGMVDVFRYTGNGSSPREINFNKTMTNPSWVNLGKETNNTSNVFRTDQSGAAYEYNQNSEHTGRITALEDTSFTVDSHSSVNAASTRYYGFVLGDYNDSRLQVADSGIDWNHLSEAVKDSTRRGVDTTTVNNLIEDYLSTSDTTALKLINPDSAVVINLKQLSSTNTNGGGLFVYKTSGTADHVLTFAASGGGVWERVEAAYNWIDPKWAGALGDGSTNDYANDYAALQKAINVAKDTANNKIIRFGKGTFRYTTELDLTLNTPLPSTTSRRNIIIEGAGIGKTILKPEGIVGLRFDQPSTNRHYLPTVRDLSIMGTAQTDTGIVIYAVNQGNFTNIQIDSFRIGYYIYNSEGLTFVNCKALYNIYGGYMLSNSNGNTFIDWSAGFNDTTGFYAKSCQGLNFKGVDQGNQPIGFEFGVAALATIEGGNSESCDSAHVIVGTSAVVSIRDFRPLENTATYWLYVLGGGICYLDNVRPGSTGSMQDNGMWVSHSSRGYLYDQSLTNLGQPALWATYSTWGDSIPVTNFEMSPAYNLASLNMANKKGKLVYGFRRANSVEGANQEALVFGQEIDTNIVVQNWLTDGNDWRFSTTGGVDNASGRVNRFRTYQGYLNFTSTAGDSSEVTIYTDTLGVDAFKFIGGFAVDKVAAGDIIDSYANIKSTNTADGSIVIIVWHKSPYDVGSLSLRLYYNVTVQAKTLGTW